MADMVKAPAAATAQGLRGSDPATSEIGPDHNARAGAAQGPEQTGTGTIVISDDSLVVDLVVTKKYASVPALIVVITPLPALTAQRK